MELTRTELDLDADGDGCFDVTEAGFTDVNGDGTLGDAPLTVDARWSSYKWNRWIYTSK